MADNNGKVTRFSDFQALRPSALDSELLQSPLDTPCNRRASDRKPEEGPVYDREAFLRGAGFCAAVWVVVLLLYAVIA